MTVIILIKRSFIVGCLTILISCSGKKFDSEKWKADEKRNEQVDNLVDSKILIGKSFDEVKDLLGHGYLSHGVVITDSTQAPKNFQIQYLTGGVKWIDFERLLITFESGRVIRTEKYYD
ncbi:MAG: hypothetical protein HZB42_14215 [Sphingobacteriales bacterium]|nr:hypothetical protein [Sphingobacteriales bacterium]